MPVPPESLLISSSECATPEEAQTAQLHTNKRALVYMDDQQKRCSQTNRGIKAGELILRHIGEDLNRVGLQDTPKRFAKALDEICSGYHKTLSEIIGNGIFPSEGPGLIAVKNIEFFSMCEHHMLPFWGHVSVAYYPDKKILGLSKVARVVELFARRLQVQERLTQEIASAVGQAVGSRAVGVRVKAAHTCMMMRGVEKQASETVTEAFENVQNLSPFERDRLLQSLGT